MKPSKVMYWADQFAKEIIDSGKYTPYWVDDMKTPSGRVHIGSVRAVLTHYLVYRALVDQGVEATFSYVLEDHDPFDKVPSYLDKEKYTQYLGLPLYKVPSPEEGYKSYGHRWGKEYVDIFNGVGVHPEIIWGSELYESGKMNPLISLVLDKADDISQIYKTLYDQAKPKGWYPFNIACEKCGKISTTVVTDWDGQQVTYSCNPDTVDYTDGCGYQGKRSPFDGNGKMPWKVEWPCKWMAIGVTVEGAGKDHMSEGGSHDFAKLMCKNILDYPVPYHFSHEFFLTSGRKMSSSKGVGSSAKEISEIIPPYLIRFMVARVRYNRAINFDPNGDSIPDLFDDYDRCSQAYWDKSDPKLARIYELSQTDAQVHNKFYRPRFREVVKILQNPKLDLEQEFTSKKGSDLTKKEKEILDHRADIARKWLKDYAPQEEVISITPEVPAKADSLSPEQRKYLTGVVDLLAQDWADPQELQQALYQLSKDQQLPAKKAFGSIYMSLLGKIHGPQAAWLLLENKDMSVKRLENIASGKKTTAKTTSITSTKTSAFAMSDEFREKYPSASIGFALISGITVTKENRDLEEERQAFLQGHINLTTEELGQYPEIQSYRKMYKDMGVSWHSRRPSPEALLRRIATGKGLYNPINTCVDAYNLVVMKNRISSGAFDADKMKGPFTIDICKGGETAPYLGDKEPTSLKAGEVCYFDQTGPYNMDYNYRDAIRTSVTPETKNIWINTEGIYDISPEAVQQNLEDNIAIILKYCGGTVEEKGMLVVD